MLYNDFSEEKADKLSKINQTSFATPESVMVQLSKNNADDSIVDKMNVFFSRDKEGPFERLKNSLAKQSGINPDTVSSLRELYTKKTFMGLRSVWEDTFPRVGRAIALKQQGVDNPWQKADVSPYKIWDAKREKGEVIDFGTAIFGDTNPEDTKQYKELIDNGASPEFARQTVLKTKGENIWTLIEEESRKVDMPEEVARELKARGKGTQATFGRVVWQLPPLNFIAGPDDRAYDFWTGVVDLGANIFDPTFIVGKVAKTVKGGTKMLALSDEAAASVGLLNGYVRKSFSKRTVKDVINSPSGDNIAEFLLKNKDKPATILEQSNFKFVNKYIMTDEQLASNTTKFMNDLKNITEEGQSGILKVKELLMENANVLAASTEGMIPEIQKVGRFSQFLDTYFGAGYQTKLKANNPDQLIVNYTKFLKSIDPKSNLLGFDRNQRLTQLLDKLDATKTKDPFLRGNIIVNAVIEDMGSLRKIVDESFETSKTLSTNGKIRAQALSKSVFTNLTKYVGEVSDDMGKNKSLYTNLSELPNEMKILWGDELTKLGWSTEDINKGFNTFANQPILESTLTRDIRLPDVSEVVKLVNTLDKSMKGQFLKAADIVGSKGIDSVMDFYVGKVFKPIALLRPAWTVRVIAEEQLRALADGVLGIRDNYLNPMSILGRMGLIDVRPSAARSGWLNNGVFEAGIGEAESRAFDNLTGNTIRQKVDWEVVQREATDIIQQTGVGNPNTKNWNEGQYRVINNYLDSKLTQAIAKIKLQGSDIESARRSIATEQLIDDMLTEGNEFREAMLSISTSTNQENVLQVLQTTTDRTVIRQFLDTLSEAVTADLSKDGNITAEMWELLATGKFKNAAGETIDIKQIARGSATKAEKALFDAGELSAKRQREIAKTNEQNMNKAIKEYVNKFGDSLTIDVKHRTKPITLDSKFYDKFVNYGMEWLMTRPTNNMSRIPVFKSTYWNKSAELISISSEAVKDKILKGAADAGINKRQIERWRKIVSAGDEGIDDPELIEQLAKGSAVQKTKDLLYDITESRRFWDVARWVFPFGNAYQEVLTTWTKLLGSNPAVASRASTVWSGSTQPTDEFTDTGKGFFFENPTNGSVVFNYPGQKLARDWMFGEAENNLNVNVNLPVYAQSLNIAATVLPGVGPTLRIPAAYFFQNFPEESFANKIIFGDFAAPDLSVEGELTKALGLKPAWFDKFLKLVYNKEENSQGVFANTVMDTYEALLYAGLIDDSTEKSFKEGMDLAVDKAKGLFAIRVVSQFLGPSGVSSPIYDITDKNGNVFMLETLADEYRSIKISNNYDDTVATQKFLQKFGFNPLALTVSKTVSIEKFPVTGEGYDWYKENKDLYEEYPYVAWYLEPPVSYAEFSYPAYREGIEQNKRVYRTPEQFAIAKNKLLGAVAMDQYEREVGIAGNNTEAAKTIRDKYKKQLMDQYWGYGQPGIVGSPTQPSTDMQIEQLQKMVNDPELQDNEQVKSIKLYLEQRQNLINITKATQDSETIWKTSRNYAGARQMLRQYADTLITENQKFGPIFDQLLAKELQPEYEDDLLLQLNESNNG
jgi:hypothetical protein